MIQTYKTLSVLFFLATPSAFIGSIWYSNWRLFFISLVFFIFSSFAASMAAAYEKSKKSTETIEDLFKALDKSTLDKLEE